MIFNTAAKANLLAQIEALEPTPDPNPLQALLDAANEQISQLLGQVEALSSQVATANEQVEALTEQLASRTDQLAVANAKIAAAQAALA